MPKQGWRLTGNGPNLTIAEVKQDNDFELASYSEAREQALTKLRGHVQPYLEQIRRLESDEFASSGRLPSLKAWQRHFNRQLVIAKTKKRAMELVGERRHWFDQSWIRCDEPWWYRYAKEEGVLIETTDERRRGTGNYVRPLSTEEGNEIANHHLESLKTISIEKLVNRIGQTQILAGESSLGTPYQVKITITESCQGNRLVIQIDVDDRLGWRLGGGRASLHRELPTQEPCNWPKERF